MNWSFTSSNSVFQIRKRIIQNGLVKTTRVKLGKEKAELGAYISIAPTSSAIEDDNKAARLLKLIAILKEEN